MNSTIPNNSSPNSSGSENSGRDSTGQASPGQLSNLQGFPGLIVDPSEAGRKLLSFLSLHLENMPGCNASVLQKWIRSGQVRVNSGRSKPFTRLEAGDQVRLPPFALPHLKQHNLEQMPVYPGLELPAPQEIPRTTLRAAFSDDDGSYPTEYNSGEENFSGAEDFFADAPATAAPAAKIIAVEEDLLVVYKPAGLAVQPGSAQADSLSERLAAYFNNNGKALFTPSPAHRLDRAASGLLLCGRSQSAQQKLHALLAEGSSDSESTDPVTEGPENSQQSASKMASKMAQKMVSRVYLAWVSGRLDLSPGTLLEDYLVKSYDSESQREFMSVGPEHGHPADAKLARSLGETLFIERMPSKITRQTYGQAYGQSLDWTERSLIKITLLSGRKHQIRVQLASRGHPIIGDPKYGGPYYPRLLLHAYSLSLPDGRRFSLLPDWPESWSVNGVNPLGMEG